MKKNTTIIFQDDGSETTKEIIGGIPLSKGEIIRVHEKDEIIFYEVIDKIVDCFLNNEEQTTDIVYVVKKK
ncbi:MAG: hypothetical protein PHZ07_03380 [Patescibacteria group bacterium]|nr:hypothetical protein [Patescibacteria group bacterium]MDD4304406.1 hypothetical protein [Patescibacteria group bacterium]MDD4695429.1 hypothetical protein [Patescibacteria group bacterium]